MPRPRLLALLAALAFAGCDAATVGGGSAERERAQVARVLRVVDGDTSQVRLDGRREKVRYIGVDTPESVKPGTPVECFAKRASAYNERLVGGRRVRLVR